MPVLVPRPACPTPPDALQYSCTALSWDSLARVCFFSHFFAPRPSHSPTHSYPRSIQAPIEEMLAFLNGLPHFVSTSSCSGRVAVFCESSDHKKQTGHWAFVSHECVADPAAVVAIVRRASMEWAAVSLKCEPLVLHMSCASLPEAQRLMKVVLGCGYKNSGMLVGKRIMVGVRSTLKLDIPVAMDGALLVSDEVGGPALAFIRRCTVLASVLVLNHNRAPLCDSNPRLRLRNSTCIECSSLPTRK